MTRHLLLSCTILLVAAGPVPEHPTMQPARDALIGYHLAPAVGEAIDIRVAYRAGGKALRVDLPDTSYVIATAATHAVTMVVPLQRTAADLGWTEGPQALFMLDERTKFTRKSDLTIAGQKCTQWEAVLEKDSRTLCVTPDGLMLRSQSQDSQGRRNLVEAFVIRYENIPDPVFTVPADFAKFLPDAASPR